MSLTLLIYSAIIIIIILIVVLAIIERKTKKKLHKEKHNLKKIYMQKIGKLKKNRKKQKEKIDILSQTAKDFFKEAFGFNYKLDYSEITEKFEQLNKKDFIKFSKEMEKVIYAKEKPDKKEISKLIKMFEKAIDTNYDSR